MRDFDWMGPRILAWLKDEHTHLFDTLCARYLEEVATIQITLD